MKPWKWLMGCTLLLAGVSQVIFSGPSAAPFDTGNASSEENRDEEDEARSYRKPVKRILRPIRPYHRTPEPDSFRPSNKNQPIRRMIYRDRKTSKYGLPFDYTSGNDWRMAELSDTSDLLGASDNAYDGSYGYGSENNYQYNHYEEEHEDEKYPVVYYPVPEKSVDLSKPLLASTIFGTGFLLALAAINYLLTTCNTTETTTTTTTTTTASTTTGSTSTTTATTMGRR